MSTEESRIIIKDLRISTENKERLIRATKIKHKKHKDSEKKQELLNRENKKKWMKNNFYAIFFYLIRMELIFLY